MWVSGGTLVWVGYHGDVVGFWSDKPFLTNVASSIAGALFGIPVAIVFIQHLMAAETQRREARTAVGVAQGAADTFLAKAARLAPSNLETLAELIQMVGQSWVVIAAWDGASAPRRPVVGGDGASQAAVTPGDVEQALQAFGLACSNLIPNLMPPSDEKDVVIKDIQAYWGRLKAHIETRAIDLGMDGIPPDDAERITTLITSLRDSVGVPRNLHSEEIFKDLLTVLQVPEWGASLPEVRDKLRNVAEAARQVCRYLDDVARLIVAAEDLSRRIGSSDFDVDEFRVDIGVLRGVHGFAFYQQQLMPLDPKRERWNRILSPRRHEASARSGSRGDTVEKPRGDGLLVHRIDDESMPRPFLGTPHSASSPTEPDDA